MGETPEIDTREAKKDRRDNVASAGLDPSTWNDLEEWRRDEQITSRSDAVRRLIRDGLEAQTPDTLRQRVIVAVSVAVITLTPVYLYITAGLTYVGVIVVITMLYVLAQPQVDTVLADLRERLPV
jgi:ABC-type transport system involved in Fe-S cluster assembly fused permease/ATPase subunit